MPSDRQTTRTSAPRLPAAFLLAAGLAAAGCGPSAPPVVPVTGTLTLGGEPAGGVLVRFLPIRAEGGESYATSEAVTDADGRYELEYRGRDETLTGAAPGQHRVLLSDYAAAEARDESVAPNRVPPLYGSAGTTPLTVTVEPADDDPEVSQVIDLTAEAVR